MTKNEFWSKSITSRVHIERKMNSKASPESESVPEQEPSTAPYVMSEPKKRTCWERTKYCAWCVYDTVPIVAILAGILAISAQSAVVGVMWDLANYFEIDGLWSAHDLYTLSLTLVIVSAILVIILSFRVFRLWEYLTCCKTMGSRKSRSVAHTAGRITYIVFFSVALLINFAAIALAIVLSYVTVVFTVVFIIIHNTCKDNKELVQSYIQEWAGDVDIVGTVDEVCQVASVGTGRYKGACLSSIFALIGLILLFASGYKDVAIIPLKSEATRAEKKAEEGDITDHKPMGSPQNQSAPEGLVGDAV